MEAALSSVEISATFTSQVSSKKNLTAIQLLKTNENVTCNAEMMGKL